MTDPIESGADGLQKAVEAFTEAFTPTTSRRKGWENLSPAYRKRLERGGITEELYKAGKKLYKARGHKEPVAARTKRKLAESNKRREANINEFVDRMERFYGRPPEQTRSVLEGLTPMEIDKLIAGQRAAEAEYMAGTTAGKRFWQRRNKRLPDWLFYYHGVFH